MGKIHRSAFYNASHYQSYPATNHLHTPSTSRRPHASFVVHGRPCRASVENGVSGGETAAVISAEKAAQKHALYGTPSTCRKPSYSHATPQSNVQLTRDISWVCTGQVEAQLRLLSAEKSLPPSGTPFAPAGPRHSHYLCPGLPLSSASSYKISYSHFKNSNLVLTAHLLPLPLPGPNILRTYRKASLAGHFGTGSSRRKLQLLCGRCERGSSLCCGDFSTHQALQCIDLGWEEGKGG